MDLSSIVQKINSLYRGIDTFSISFSARQKMAMSEDKSLVYGETKIESLAEILKIVEPKKGEIFYDLGSGGGKVVLAAAMMFPFTKVVGIEKLPELAGVSNFALRQAQDINTAVEFRCQDFLEADFSDADIIFINSTCLSYAMMDALAIKMENLKTGARIITVTKQLKANYLQEFKSKHFEFSWGSATVYFYKKLPPLYLNTAG